MPVNFVTIKQDIVRCIKKWNKDAHDYGVGYKEEFEIALISPYEVNS